MPKVNEIVDQAKQGGVDMSWLAGTQATPQDPLREVAAASLQPNPTGQGMLNAVARGQEKSSIYSPFKAGTPTLQKTMHDDQMRLARSRAGGGGGSGARMAPGVHNVAGSIQAAVAAAARDGKPFSEVIKALNDPSVLMMFQQYGVKMDDAIALAKQYYEPTLQAGQFASGVSVDYGQPRISQYQGSVQTPLQGAFDSVHNFASQYGTRSAQEKALEMAMADFGRYSPAQQDRLIQPGLYEGPNGNYIILPSGQRIEAQ